MLFISILVKLCCMVFVIYLCKVFGFSWVSWLCLLLWVICGDVVSLLRGCVRSSLKVVWW